MVATRNRSERPTLRGFVTFGVAWAVICVGSVALAVTGTGSVPLFLPVLVAVLSGALALMSVGAVRKVRRDGMPTWEELGGRPPTGRRRLVRLGLAAATVVMIVLNIRQDLVPDAVSWVPGIAIYLLCGVILTLTVKDLRPPRPQRSDD